MALESLKRSVARSASLTRLLFGVRVPHRTAQGHWDYSTLVLFDELHRQLRPGLRVLEMGVGEAATLSVALARLVPASYLALDVGADAIESARRVGAHNKVEVEFLQSDLFASLPPDRAFDFTFFNPPYVPRALTARWRAFGEPERVWDGGEDGLDVIRRFWSAAEPLRPRLGRVLMGFNRRSVAEAQVEALAAASGYEVASVKRAFHPGTVVTFTARAAAGRNP